MTDTMQRCLDAERQVDAIIQEEIDAVGTIEEDVLLDRVWRRLDAIDPELKMLFITLDLYRQNARAFVAREQQQAADRDANRGRP